MPANQTYYNSCYSSGASADMSKFCDKVPPGTPPTGISQQSANEVENLKHNRICLIDSDAPSHWLKTKLFVDTYTPSSATYRPEYRFRNAMQAMTVNQRANEDAETMHTFFTQVGTITNANMESVTTDLNQIKADAESASAPAHADLSHADAEPTTDDKIISILGVEKNILPEWLLDKLGKIIDQVIDANSKAKQTLAEGGNDTDMSSLKGASTASEPGRPSKKVRTSTTPPKASKAKPKESEHTFFSSDEENEKMRVAARVAKIENAASRRKDAKAAKLAGQEKVKKGGGKSKR